MLASWSNDYFISKENKLRSLNLYYFHVFGKRKYLSIRKANKQATLEIWKLPNFVSYNVFSKTIVSIDIGKLYKIIKPLGIKQEKVGLSGPLAEYILHLASFYLKVELVREDKLKVFPKMPKKDPDSFFYHTSNRYDNISFISKCGGKATQ